MPCRQKGWHDPGHTQQQQQQQQQRYINCSDHGPLSTIHGSPSTVHSPRFTIHRPAVPSVGHRGCVCRRGFIGQLTAQPGLKTFWNDDPIVTLHPTPPPSSPPSLPFLPCPSLPCLALPCLAFLFCSVLFAAHRIASHLFFFFFFCAFLPGLKHDDLIRPVGSFRQG